VSAWNTGQVTDMALMFNQATSFDHNILGWNDQSVTTASQMFNNATAWASVFIRVDGGTSTDGPPADWKYKIAPPPPSPPPSPPPFPPPPPSPPPSPPPTCGNGVYDSDGTNPDGSVGETCDPQGNTIGDVVGCDATTCQPKEGWKCDDVSMINTDSYNCTCSNVEGEYATVETLCENQGACQYPARCLAEGKGCAPGSGGDRCRQCLTSAQVAEILLAGGNTSALSPNGYFKAGQLCEVCPPTSLWQVIIAGGFVLVGAFTGFKVSQYVGPTATNNFKKAVEALQFFSLSLNMDLSWPGPVINIGNIFDAFSFNLEFLRPECVATGINWLNIFLTSVFGVPAALFFIITLNVRRASRRYEFAIRNIHCQKNLVGDYVFWIEKRTLWGTRRTSESIGGDLVVKKLQKLYSSRITMRNFGTLSMTVLYLPIIRLCLQSFDCIDVAGFDGERLEYDVDIVCSSSSHRAIQAVSGILLVLIGIGLPLAIFFKVRSIFASGKSNDPRTIDLWGSFYDIYRRNDLSYHDKIQIAAINNHTLRQNEDEHDERQRRQGWRLFRGIGDSVDASGRVVAKPTAPPARRGWKMAMNIADNVDTSGRVVSNPNFDERTNRVIRQVISSQRAISSATGNVAAHATDEAIGESDADAKTRNRVNRVMARVVTLGRGIARTVSTIHRERHARMLARDRIAVHYLSLELMCKSLAIMMASSRVQRTALGGWGIVVVFWSFSIIIRYVQPWRPLTLGFGKYQIENCVNRIELISMFSEGALPTLAMIFPVQTDSDGNIVRNTSFNVMVIVMTFVIIGSVTLRILMILSERLSVRRDHLKMVDAPEESVERITTRIVEFAKDGLIVSLYLYSNHIDITRRKVRARLEATRIAMLELVRELRSYGITEHDERATALHELADKIGHTLNILAVKPPPEGPAVVDRIKSLKEYERFLLSHARSTYKRKRANRNTEEFAALEALFLAMQVHAYDKTIERLDEYMREYSEALLLPQVVELGQLYPDLVRERAAVPKTFGNTVTEFKDRALFKMKKALTADLTASVERDNAAPSSASSSAYVVVGFMAPHEEELYRSFTRVVDALQAVEAPIQDYVQWVKASHDALANIATSREIPPKPPITAEVFEADMLDALARHEDIVVEEARASIASTPDGRRNASVTHFLAQLKRMLERDCKRCVASIHEKAAIYSFHEAIFIADAYLRASAECESKLRELRASTRFLGDVVDAARRDVEGRRGYVEEAKEEALRLKRKQDRMAQENVLDDIFGGGRNRKEEASKTRESRAPADVLSGALGVHKGRGTRAKEPLNVEQEREEKERASSYARAREWAMPDEDAMDALARARRVVHVAASASTTAAPIESPSTSTRRGDSKPKAGKRSFDPASML